MNGRYIAFIHAKSSSKRLPHKNMKDFGGQPLFTHAIKNAVKSKIFDEIVIDSNSDEIIDIGLEYGATAFLKRQPHQATNSFTGDDLAYWQASNYPDSDVCVQVIPTSPFISPRTLIKTINILARNRYKSVVGVRHERQYVFSFEPKEGKLLNSFELKPTVVETTGLYASLTKAILESKKRTSYPVFPLPLSKVESIDINNGEDFYFAKIVLEGLGGHYC